MRSKRSTGRTLGLDKEHKKFLGVCAGIARYLEVEPWSVRLVFLVSIFFGAWFLVPIYFIAWFCLDDKASNSLSGLSDNHTLKHFRTVDYKKQLYRNTEDAKFLGVCSGVADYLEVNVFAVRLGFLILVFFAAMIPILLYFGAYFILEEKPASRRARTSRFSQRRQAEAAQQAAQDTTRPAAAGTGRTKRHANAAKEHGLRRGASTEEAETTTYSKRREFKYCARKLSTLQDRLARMEAWVTSKQFRLHREFKNI